MKAKIIAELNAMAKIVCVAALQGIGITMGVVTALAALLANVHHFL